MSKETLVEIIVSQTGSTKKEAESAIKMVMDGITKSMALGKDVNLVGFGKFEIAERAARMGRNPATGVEIKIPASKTVKFKAGKTLKEALV
jgi:DNA-binding protein HU-beta